MLLFSLNKYADLKSSSCPPTAKVRAVEASLSQPHSDNLPIPWKASILIKYFMSYCVQHVVMLIIYDAPGSLQVLSRLMYLLVSNVLPSQTCPKSGAAHIARGNNSFICHVNDNLRGIILSRHVVPLAGYNTSHHLFFD